MTHSELEFHFASPVLRLDTGMRQHYVPLPNDIAEQLKTAGVRRVLTTVNGYTISRGIQGKKDGEKYLMLGKSILREMKAQYGDMIEIMIAPDPTPDEIDVCEELAVALEQDDEARERFESMLPSHRRGLNYHVDSAKRPGTREKRALEIAFKLRTYTLYSDLNKLDR